MWGIIFFFGVEVFCGFVLVTVVDSVMSSFGAIVVSLTAVDGLSVNISVVFTVLKLSPLLVKELVDNVEALVGRVVIVSGVEVMVEVSVLGISVIVCAAVIPGSAASVVADSTFVEVGVINSVVVMAARVSARVTSELVVIACEVVVGGVFVVVVGVVVVVEYVVVAHFTRVQVGHYNLLKLLNMYIN